MSDKPKNISFTEISPAANAASVSEFTGFLKCTGFSEWPAPTLSEDPLIIGGKSRRLVIPYAKISGFAFKATRSQSNKQA